MPRGPSEAELGKAYVFSQARQAVTEYLESEDDVKRLHPEMLQLPTLDVSLQVSLPRIFTPKLARLGEIIEAHDDEALDRELPELVREFDTWPVRARLARSVMELRDQGRLDGELAAVALADLASGSIGFLESSLLQAIAVATGAVKSPAGILIAQ